MNSWPSNGITLILLGCGSIFIGTASRDSEAGRCLNGPDELNLIQTKTNVELGIKRGAEKHGPGIKHGEQKHGPGIEHGAAKQMQKKFLPLITSPSYTQQLPPMQLPDLTVDSVKPGQAKKIVDESVNGIMPILGSLPKRMATVNLAFMALNVPGDFVETGVFAGSTAILMGKVLKKWGGQDRHLWAADSFQGVPEEDPRETALEQNLTQDHIDLAWNGRVSNRIGIPGQYSFSREKFEKNLEANGLGNSTTNPQIQVLPGWFSQTLPSAPIQRISFLRLDGDIYRSTWDALNSLYGKVANGGLIYVDDYGSFAGCHHAVDEFRTLHGITDPMYPIYESGDRYDAVWWQKRNR